MSKQTVQELANRIKDLLQRKNELPACDDVTVANCHGYYISPNETKGWVTVYYVDARPGQIVSQGVRRFNGIYEPLLSAAFGGDRVKYVTVRMRIAGKQRMVHGLRVAVAS